MTKTRDLAAIISGAIENISYKQAVRVATTANATFATAYANGQTLDGVTLATGDRILIKNQTSGAYNGIFNVSESGAPIRVDDASTGAELVYATCYVREGTVNGNTEWQCRTDPPITIDGTALEFFEIKAAGAALEISINQPAHGFPEPLAGRVIKSLASGTYELAIASSDTDGESLGFMFDRVDADNFKYAPIGEVELTTAEWDACTYTTGTTATSGGLTPGTSYFLSELTDGFITADPTTTHGHVNKSILIATSATKAIIQNHRGVELSDTYGKYINVTWANLNGGSTYDVVHGLGIQHVHVTVRDSDGNEIRVDNAPKAGALDTTLTFDFGGALEADFPMTVSVNGTGSNTQINVDNATPPQPLGAVTAGDSGYASPMNHVHPGYLIRDQHRGLVCSRSAVATVDIDIDEIILQNTDGMCIRAADIDLAANIETLGAGSTINGLDTTWATSADEAASTWYHIWVISNGTTVASLLSESATAPTMPTGYTYKAYVGAVYNDSGKDFDNFHQIDKSVITPKVNLFDCTDAAFTSKDLSAFIPSTAKKFSVSTDNYTSGSVTGAKGEFSPVSDGSLGVVQIGWYNSGMATGSKNFYGYATIHVLTPQTTWAKRGYGNFYPNLTGWEY